MIHRVNLYREYTCFLYPPYLFIVLILTPFLTGVANLKKTAESLAGDPADNYYIVLQY